ncbi:N-acetylmuramoyl-L-alanine amidase [Mesorhizobium sp. RMAD-H1]|uniref:N-acetylmuramoyl-L-alanine amidase n=1 Tax=Mesorhizobium sp. RMAD-H1 TaxID=2587065 RepID=UPI0016093D08|nr:N-acetylmuramoyl-L-alanine amidase [Mesorhizobium sp. RMAD-H1]MBB2970480.1 N-acetylmuramoyl-L-alanine amidase [Mesorhizobium sp. RMAD-H1]
MAYSVKKHLLTRDKDPVAFVQTPNGGASLRPLYLIIHYTAGTAASSAINWFRNKQSSASAHLVIGPDGDVTQMMPFNKLCWHAGKSRWNDLVGMNAYSVGIEIVNAGKLRKSEAGTWLAWSGEAIAASDVLMATHKHETNPAGWHIFTEAQIAAVVDAGLALQTEYHFLDVLGHDDIAPGRKVDPGPAFPMISVRSRILGRQDNG